jgi:hypothetical protein
LNLKAYDITLTMSWLADTNPTSLINYLMGHVLFLILYFNSVLLQLLCDGVALEQDPMNFLYIKLHVLFNW